MNTFAFIIALVVILLTMIYTIVLVLSNEVNKPRNKVRFYMTSDSILHPGWLQLWMGKPVWDKKLLMWIQPNNHVFFLTDSHFQEYYNINPKDFEDMKPKEIREVFINLED